jgi:hypothetical protein
MWEIMEVAETDFKRYHAMLVRIELEDGRTVAALADTGAMTSVWAWNSLPGLTAKLGLRPSKMSLRHAGGGGMQMAGEASPEFKFKGGTEWVKRPVQIAAKGVMPDGLRILGVEVWDSLNATINFHKRCITVRYKSGKVEDIPFTVTRKDSPVLGAIASLTGDNHEMQGSPVARLRDGIRLAPGQPAEVQVTQLGKTGSDTWEAFWEPAPISMALGDCSLGTEQDFTDLQFSTQGFVPCKQEGNRLIATVQLLNPTDQWLDLAPGQVIGKVDWAQQIPAEDVLGEELDVRRAEVAAGIALSPAQQEREDEVKKSSLDWEPIDLPKDDWRAGVTDAKKVIEAISDDDPGYLAWLKIFADKGTFGESLKPERKVQLHKLHYVFQKLFSLNPKAPPPVKGVEFRLIFKTNDPIPWCQPVPRLSPSELSHMDKDTRMMLANDIIEYSDSEWATAPVFAKKKDGTLRYAINYKWLNSQCRSDSFSVPNQVDLIESLGKAKYASSFDCSSGYWAMSLRKEDRPYTAFHAYVNGSWTLMQAKRMMFGLKTATASWSRMYNKVIGKELMARCCKAYVDDVTAWTAGDFDEHLDDLLAIFKRLEANGISLKMQKCIWCADKLALLGHVVVLGRGTQVDPEKVEAMMQIAPPEYLSELKTLLGAAGYLSRFIPEYAAMVAPLRELETKYVSKNAFIGHEWENPKYRAAFVSVKTALSTAPVLAFPDWSKPFIILTDASAGQNGQLGACLAQLDDDGVERPIAYSSTPLTKAQKNYGISDVEGLAVVVAVRKWRSYILHTLR